MKNLMNLNVVKILSSKEQKAIGGGMAWNNCARMICTWRCLNGKCIDKETM